MVNQVPAQETPNAFSRRPTDFLNDPTFTTIHDLLLLGWSLIELKSRIQIVACNLSLDVLTFNEDATFSASILNVPSSDGGLSQSNSIATTLTNIVLKDVPLKAIVQSQPGIPSNTPTRTLVHSLAAELQDNTRLTSTLRAIFSRIVALHIQCFPISSTRNTVYDLSSSPWDMPELSFLYPRSEPDYARVGVTHLTVNDTDSLLAAFVENFILYDLTRRALNCLTILLDTATESLVPSVTGEYQNRLMQAMRVAKAIPFFGQDTDQPPTPDDIEAAIQVLSNLVIHLLEAWDSFLLENFYTFISIATGAGNTPTIDYQTQLGAYQVGRSLASLSWGVLVAMVPLESALSSEDLHNAQVIVALKKKVQMTWYNAFNDRDIKSLQSQITALGTAMDAAYYRRSSDRQASDTTLTPVDLALPVQMLSAIQSNLNSLQNQITALGTAINADYYRRNPDRQVAGSDTTFAPVDLAVPSQMLSAIKSSLDYWQRAVVSMDSASNSPSTLSPAIPNLTWHVSLQLRAALTQQAEIWQSLLLYRQNLKAYTRENVSRRIYYDFRKEFDTAANTSLVTSVVSEQRKRTITVITLSILFVTLLAILLIPWPGLKDKTLLTIVVSTATVIAGFIGTVATTFTTFRTSILNIPSKKEADDSVKQNPIERVFSLTNAEVESIFQKGYQQILLEFNDLNQGVSITKPLVDFFIRNSTSANDTLKASASLQGGSTSLIKDDYEFLTNIIWSDKDQNEEIEQRTRAAFGLVGTYVKAQLGLSRASN